MIERGHERSRPEANRVWESIMEDGHPVRRAPDDLVLRAIRPDDAEAYARLINLPGFLWGTTQLPFTSPERVRAYIEQDTGDGRSLVGLVGETLVGQASLHRHRARRSHVGEIGIGVHDDWVGRGVGTALMAAVVELADGWLGLSRLELTVLCDNTAALALYRRFGFAIEGTHKSWIYRGGVLVDAHTMARVR